MSKQTTLHIHEILPSPQTTSSHLPTEEQKEQGHRAQAISAK
jgi:hypothetical protein